MSFTGAFGKFSNIKFINSRDPTTQPVVLAVGGKGVFKNCTISRSGTSGVHLSGNGVYKFINCTIKKSEFQNFLANDGSNVQLINCSIIDSKAIGLNIQKNSICSFKQYNNQIQ